MVLWLERDEVLCLPRVTPGLMIRCERGAAWLTQKGDPADHTLQPGANHTIARRGRVVVWAAEGCALRLEPAAHRAKLGLHWNPALSIACGPSV